MTTVSLQYVGKKPSHEDLLYGTGTWASGEVKKVKREIAPFLLWHDDVWKDARTHAARKKDQITPSMKPPVMRHDERETDMPAINLANMDARGLANYAKNTFGRNLDASRPAADLRAEVRTLMRTAP